MLQVYLKKTIEAEMALWGTNKCNQRPYAFQTVDSNFSFLDPSLTLSHFESSFYLFPHPRLKAFLGKKIFPKTNDFLEGEKQKSGCGTSYEILIGKCELFFVINIGY